MSLNDTLTNTFRTEFFPESPLCAEVDGDLFFPENSKFKHQITQAKAFCFICTERTECRDYALKANEKDGIWGGLDEEERRVIRWNDKVKVKTYDLDGLTPEQISSKNEMSIEYVQKLLEELGRVPRGWMKGEN